MKYLLLVMTNECCTAIFRAGYFQKFIYFKMLHKIHWQQIYLKLPKKSAYTTAHAVCADLHRVPANSARPGVKFFRAGKNKGFISGTTHQSANYQLDSSIRKHVIRALWDWRILSKLSALKENDETIMMAKSKKLCFRGFILLIRCIVHS